MAIEFNRLTIGGGYSTSKINTNFERIEEALEDAISRSGENPNTMEADLDLNNNDLLNVGTGNFNALIVNGHPVVGDNDVDSEQLVPAGGTDGQVLKKASDVDYDVEWAEDDGTPVATTRTELKAVDTTKYTVAILTEAGREGTFIWRLGNYSTQVTADTAEGIYIKADAVASSSGAWVREYDGPLNIDWFGASPKSSTDSAAAMNAAYSLLKTISGITEGCIGRIVAPGPYYTFASSIGFDKPVALDMPGFWRYTPTTGSALVIGVTTPTGGQNTGYDIRIGGFRAMNGNTAAPTGYNSSGNSAVEIRNMQFSTLWVGRIIAFTKAGFWGNQTNDAYTGQHCQDNTISLGDVAYCGEGVRVESISGSLGAFQVNWMQVQNSFGNWTNFRIGGTGDNNTNNNIFVFHAMDADTGGGAGFVRGLYNDIQFGYANGTIAFESGSAYNRCFAQVGAAQVTFTDAGTGNEIKRATEGWTTPNVNTPPIRVESTEDGATFAELIKLKRSSPSPASNDGGVGIGLYFNDDTAVERLGGRIRTDMPSVEGATTNRNLRILFDTLVGGTLANRAIIWQGLVLGSPTSGDKGTGTLNATGLYINGNTVSYRLQGTATFDPISLVDGAGVTTTVTVTGAALGDMALASFSLDTQGIVVTAWVSAANTVSVRFQNESGGTLDIASGTLKAWVLK